MEKLFYPLNVLHHLVHIRAVDFQLLPKIRERETVMDHGIHLSVFYCHLEAAFIRNNKILSVPLIASLNIDETNLKLMFF